MLLEDHVPPTVFMGTVMCMDYTQNVIIIDFAVPMKVSLGLDTSLVLSLSVVVTCLCYYRFRSPLAPSNYDGKVSYHFVVCLCLSLSLLAPHRTRLR